MDDVPGRPHREPLLADAAGVLVGIIVLLALGLLEVTTWRRLGVTAGTAISVRMALARYLATRDLMTSLNVLFFYAFLSFLVLLAMQYRDFLSGIGLMAQTPPNK